MSDFDFNKSKVLALSIWEQQFIDEIMLVENALNDLLSKKAECEAKIEVWENIKQSYPEKVQQADSEIEKYNNLLMPLEINIADYKRAYEEENAKYAPYISTIRHIKGKY